MSKEIKLYIPVTCIKPVQRLKNHRKITVNERRTTYVAVHNCPTIKAEMPDIKDITEHVMIQNRLVKAGGQFNSIKVSVTPALYQKFCKEISDKMCGRYISPIIDIILQSTDHLPLIQIQGNKDVPPVRRMVRPDMPKRHMIRTK